MSTTHAANSNSASASRSAGSDSHSAPPAFATRAADAGIDMELSGAWTANQSLPRFAELRDAFERQLQDQPTQHQSIQHQSGLQNQSATPRCWRMIAADDFQWDSQCMTRLFLCARYCAERDIEFDTSALAEGMQKLLALANAVKPQVESATDKFSMRQQWLAVFGRLRAFVREFLEFIGALVLALFNLARGKANTRLRDFFYFVEQCGPQAFGIVALISVLVGMILAYLGSVQLRQFGAEVYVANLVGIGMMREMGALMTAVIMAGRTGAAYAAQLGAMQANEEIDAITTLGISPMEYLVVPRFLALLAVMPLLCIFADVLGLFGGALVATGMDVNSAAFFHQAREAVHFDDIFTGLIKSVAFAALIAIAGCQAGLQSGRSSAAVGQATTRAVVNAIVYLVIADAGLNILYDKLGF